MRNRLRRNEKDAIRLFLEGNPLYVALKKPTNDLCFDSPFKLSAEEMVLWCLEELDDIKESPAKIKNGYNSFVNDLQIDFLDMMPNEAQEADVLKPSCQLAILLTICLTALKRQHYADLIIKLVGQIPYGLFTELSRIYNANLYTSVGEESFAKYIQEYMASDEFLSDVIEEMLKKLPVIGERPNTTESAKTSLKISDGKQTSVIVVLNAMYKSGWFVKKDGSKMSNRNNTLNEILRFAFNQEGEANISQLLNTAKNRNLDGLKSYLKELEKVLK